MIFPRRRIPLRTQIPTVRVILATDDGEVHVRARWNRRPIDLQRRILFLIRQGHSIFLEDEWGHGICFRPEHVWGARVDANPASHEAPREQVSYRR